MFSLYYALLFLLFLNLVHLQSRFYLPANLLVPEEVLDVNVYELFENASLTDEIVISSPNFPENYTDNTRVAYWIRGHGRPIQISKKSFALQANEDNGTCLKDYLAIWDLRYPYYPKLVVCGNGSTLPFYSYSDSVMMLLFSDKETNAPGFQLSVQVSRRCGEDALTCPSDKNKCVEPDYICDGRPDCPGGEDEICNRKCGIPNSEAREETSRIVGGVEAVRNAWPWQAVLIIAGSLCGGSLLAPGWIVSAAHCCTAPGEQPHERRVHDPSSFAVRLGFHSCKDSSDGVTVAVDKVFIPGPYQQGRWGANFDMCILKLKETVTLSNKIQPICLPRPFSGPVGRQMCTATGCGSMVQSSGSGTGPPRIMADNLMVVNLTVVDSTECYKQYAKLTPEMLCTLERDKDTCQGDSGGPLACTGVDKSIANQYQLSGIVSFGRGCASNQPGVFANSRRLLPFLIQMVYAEKKWGWFEDTSVPVIDHATNLRSLFQPRVIVTQTPSRGVTTDGAGALAMFLLLYLVLFV